MSAISNIPIVFPLLSSARLNPAITTSGLISSIFVYIFPMQKYVYLGLFVFVQLWTILIHDGDMITGSWWEKYINSAAHHTLHHLYFTCNYGQVSCVPLCDSITPHP